MDGREGDGRREIGMKEGRKEERKKGRKKRKKKKTNNIAKKE